jgi:hypothetical protein
MSMMPLRRADLVKPFVCNEIGIKCIVERKELAKWYMAQVVDIKAYNAF